MNDNKFNPEVYSLLKKICMYCLNDSADLRSIYKVDDSSINLAEFTQILMGINFTSIGYCTPLICSSCLTKLLACYEFRQLCLESMEQLQNIILQTDAVSDTKNLVDLDVIKELKIEQVNVENDEDQVTYAECFEVDQIEKTDQKDEIIMLNIDPQSAEKVPDFPEPMRFKNRYGNCPICGCVKSDVKRHLKSHINDDKYKPGKKGPRRRKKNCPICCEAKSNLGTHLRSHKLEKHKLLNDIRNQVKEGVVLPVSAICQLCDKSSDNILHHFQTFHIETDDKDNGCERYEVCHICGSNVIHLKKHLKNHMDSDLFTCDLCKKTFTKKSGLKEHLKIHLNKREYKCRICPAAFNVSSSLRVHMNNHIGYKKHKCNDCDKSFLESCQLTRHMRVAHIKSYNLQCHYCDKVFCEQSHRRKHERRIHTERDYPCKLCTKIFTSEPRYYQHMRTHIKINPFICKICDLKFYRTVDYRTHLRLHVDEH